MNYLNLYSFGLSFIFWCTQNFAQERVAAPLPDIIQPTLFSKLPGKIFVDTGEFKKLFKNNAAKRKEVNVRFIDKTLPRFYGKIISATSKYNNTPLRVVVSSTRFNGATLTVSSTTTDGTVRYSGRIVSFHHDDLYVLQEEQQQYFLIKKRFDKLANE
ncbi:MAG: hypothetical protein ACXWWC_02405 [Chitinophagaceae bacterium]